MKVIVVGSLMTDIFAKGISHFPPIGEYVHGNKVTVSAGGRPRNIAEMTARLAPKDTVSMVGKTIRDAYNLWKPPVDALKKSGVNTEYVTILDGREGNMMPDISLIAVDNKGRSQMYTVFGDAVLTIEDIQAAGPLFERAGRENGTLIVTISVPLEVLRYSVQLAHKSGMRVLFDPGGIRPGSPPDMLSGMPVYLIKPNEYEAKVLTGVDVVNLSTASRAAHILQSRGYENVLITVGADGAYLFTKNGTEKHIRPPEIASEAERNETGCGDQVMAVLCAFLNEGYDMERAAELAIKAGTLQLYRNGAIPLTREDLGSVI